MKKKKTMLNSIKVMSQVLHFLIPLKNQKKGQYVYHLMTVELFTTKQSYSILARIQTIPLVICSAVSFYITFEINETALH